MNDHSVGRLRLQLIVCVVIIGLVSTWGRYDSPAPRIIPRWVQHLGGVFHIQCAAGTTTVRPYQLNIRERSARKLFMACPSTLESSDALL